MERKSFMWLDNTNVMYCASCRGKTNFFERRVGEYQKSGVMAGLKGGMHAHEFTTDADF